MSPLWMKFANKGHEGSMSLLTLLEQVAGPMPWGSFVQ